MDKKKTTIKPVEETVEELKGEPIKDKQDPLYDPKYNYVSTEDSRAKGLAAYEKYLKRYDEWQNQKEEYYVNDNDDVFKVYKLLHPIKVGEKKGESVNIPVRVEMGLVMDFAQMEGVTDREKTFQVFSRIFNIELQSIKTMGFEDVEIISDKLPFGSMLKKNS